MTELQKVPNQVATRLQWHLGQLLDMKQRIERGRALDARFQGDGRYEFDATGGATARNQVVDAAEAFFAQFRQLAAQNNVDANQVFSQLGGIPDVPHISEAAQEWDRA